MNALKGVVILMSVAIAILMSLIIYGLYQKSQDADFKFFNLGGKDKPPAAVLPNAPVSGALQDGATSVGNINLNLPKGARVISATASGTKLIVIIATDGKTANQVWVVDLASGKVLSRVNTGP